MNDLKRYKRIQELLDEGKDPGFTVRESNSEIVWRLWDEAVETLDPKPRARAIPVDHSRFADCSPSNWDLNCL